MKWDNGSWTENVPAGKVSFSVVDINRDGIPELFLSTSYVYHAMGYEAVYIFDEGKVKFACSEDGIKSYYPNSGIVEMSKFEYGWHTRYWKIDNGEADIVASIDSTKSTYDWKNKEVTKTKFHKLLKKNAGKKVNVTDKYWHKNTSSNRKNMLKMVKW